MKATVDEKGRVKIPAAFLEDLREYGNKFYVTSESGESVRVYPMKVWNKIEEKLASKPSYNRAKQKFLMQTSYYGQVVELDGQGRILVPPILREAAQGQGRRLRDGQPGPPADLEPRAVRRDAQGQFAGPRGSERARDLVSAGHTPVLAEEAVRWLRVDPAGTYLDATVGLGGHALENHARQLTTGRLVGLDRDAQALEIARERLKEFEERVTLVKADFSNIDEVARELGLVPLQGVLADLGVSSMELETPERGFSFRLEGPLDMRMDSETAALTAEEIVNTFPEAEIADLLYRFAEERDSRRIARAIVRARPIRSTTHLATVVAGARPSRGRQRLHPATKTFLALRIAVNRELEALGQFLQRAPATLAPGGRWVVISYHSLEDRMVKHEFQRLGREGTVLMY